jgi:hypothetical protein
MLARLSIFGLAASLAAASSPSLSRSPSPGTGPVYTLETTGALRQSVSGTEAHYSISPEMVDGKRELAIALGPKEGDGAIWLFTGAEEPLRPGLYPVVYHWTEHRTGAAREFHACYLPGSARHPLGMFHSESGWLTITESEPGRIAGSFELRARGFLATDEKDENQWVTVRGTYSAEGDRVVASER